MEIYTNNMRALNSIKAVGSIHPVRSMNVVRDMSVMSHACEHKVDWVGIVLGMLTAMLLVTAAVMIVRIKSMEVMDNDNNRSLEPVTEKIAVKL